MTDYKDLIVRLIARHESLYGKGAVPSCITEAADAIEALVKERDSFYMDHRMKCDAETKRLDTELSALRKQIDELQPVAWKHTNSNILGVQINDMAPGYYGGNWKHVPLFSLEGIKK